jgi:intein/homing endonuclease
MTDTVNYNVHEVFCEILDFNLLIVEIPKEDLEDKLTYFVKDEGLVSKIIFEDFLIATCVANINKVLYKISNPDFAEQLNFLDLRKNIVEAILNKNPDFNYNNIVINKNKVLKLVSLHEELTDVTNLIDNSLWDADLNELKNVNGGKEDIDKESDQGSGEKSLDKKKGGALYTTKDKWWKLIGKYVSIKIFKAEDLALLLNGRFFHSRVSFNTFVVTLCVEDSEALFQLLENMGIPARVSPPLLMKELCALCQSCNPFLTYESAQELASKDKKQPECTECNTSKQASSGNTAMGQFANKVEKKKKVFADVPEEDLLSLATNMKVSLVGQDKVVNSLTDAIQRASVGLKDPVKPIGSFLFAGKTGTGKCVEKGTLIFSEGGIKPIEDFYYGEESQMPLKIKVSSTFGPSYTEYIYKEGTKAGRRITTNIGNTLGGSLVHPVATLSETGDVEFKRFYELTTDDHVAVQYNQNFFSTTNKELVFKYSNELDIANNTLIYKIPSEMSVDLAYYIGLLIGDGGLSIKNSVYFTNTDKQLVRDFYNLSNKLFGIVPKNTSNDITYVFHSAYIYSFLEDACNVPMCKSTNKFIPNSILESTKECIVAFIQGLMDTDGYYETRRNVGITLSTTKLIEQLQIVLMNFGIVSSVRHRKVKYMDTFNDAWVLLITGKFVKKYFDTIGFRLRKKQDKANLLTGYIYNPNKDIIPNISSKLSELVSNVLLPSSFYSKYTSYIKGFRRPSQFKLNKMLDDLKYIVGDSINQNKLYVYLKSFTTQDLFWAKVDYIEDLDLDLYDFTVPETHTFISNGIVSHNTLTGKILANELIKDRDNLITIDCSEYSADHEYSKLIGAPTGYMGYENGGLLTNAVMENPFSVVVFDEIEKASSKIYQLLLQVLEEGRLTDNKGNKVSFKDTVIILTSNIGVENISNISKTIGFGDVNVVTESKKEKAIEEALKKKFKPEFLNRLDEVIYFNDLTKEDYLRIIDIELFKLNSNLQNNQTKYKDLELVFDKKVCEFIYEKGVTKEYGARPLKRAIERHISTPLAIKLLKGITENDTVVTVTASKGDVAFKFSKKTSKPPIYLEKPEPKKELSNV